MPQPQSVSRPLHPNILGPRHESCLTSPQMSFPRRLQNIDTTEHTAHLQSPQGSRDRAAVRHHHHHRCWCHLVEIRIHDRSSRPRVKAPPTHTLTLAAKRSWKKQKMRRSIANMGRPCSLLPSCKRATRTNSCPVPPTRACRASPNQPTSRYITFRFNCATTAGVCC